MPYESIDDLPDKVILKALKKRYEKKNGRWVKRASREIPSHALKVSGPVFPIGVRNANGWGIPESEVENAIASLRDAVVRICNTRGDEHACDAVGDRFAEIGFVYDAYRLGDEVWVDAYITDREAIRKLEDGTWERKWSIFGTGKEGGDGLVRDIRIEALTIVRNPAWDVGFNIAASMVSEFIFSDLNTPGGENLKQMQDKEAAEWDRRYVNDLPDSAFAYIEPCYKRGDTENKNARHLPHHNRNGDIDLPHLRNALARVSQVKPICPDTSREEMIREAREHLLRHARQEKIGEFREAAKEEDTMKENEENHQASTDEASHRGEPGVETSKEASGEAAETSENAEKTTYTREEVDKMISAAVEKAKAETIEQLRREQLVEELVEVYASLGIEKDREKLLKRCSASLEEELEDIRKIAEKVQAAENKFAEAKLGSGSNTKDEVLIPYEEGGDQKEGE
jgi:hypothetical protein